MANSSALCRFGNYVGGGGPGGAGRQQISPLRGLPPASTKISRRGPVRRSGQDDEGRARIFGIPPFTIRVHPNLRKARSLGTPVSTPTCERRAVWGPRFPPQPAKGAQFGDPGFHPNLRKARSLGHPGFHPTLRMARSLGTPFLHPNLRTGCAVWGPVSTPTFERRAVRDPGLLRVQDGALAMLLDPIWVC